MLCIIDEFTRECLSICVERKLNTEEVMEELLPPSFDSKVGNWTPREGLVAAATLALEAMTGAMMAFGLRSHLSCHLKSIRRVIDH